MKDETRQRSKRLIANIDRTLRDTWDESISCHVRNLLENQKDRSLCVGSFHSLKDEPHLNLEADLCFPHILGPGQMVYRNDQQEDVVPHVVVVPALGYSRQGKRLGRGGGFFDRYSAKHQNLLFIGVCYSAALIDDDNLFEDHDLQVNYLVTESQVLTTKPHFSQLGEVS